MSTGALLETPSPAAFLHGTVEEAALSTALDHSRAERAARLRAGLPTVGEEDAPQGTQTKTCKPTRNPCCKPPGEDEPDDPQNTKAQTCKPTRNPCCKPPDEDEPGASSRAAVLAGGSRGRVLV